jgi:hypothetical protein
MRKKIRGEWRIQNGEWRSMLQHAKKWPFGYLFDTATWWESEESGTYIMYPPEVIRASSTSWCQSARDPRDLRLTPPPHAWLLAFFFWRDAHWLPSCCSAIVHCIGDRNKNENKSPWNYSKAKTDTTAPWTATRYGLTKHGWTVSHVAYRTADISPAGRFI